MTPENAKVLQDIGTTFVPNVGMPWTQTGTRANQIAEELEDHGFVKCVGRSATGRYWALTPEGFAEAYPYPPKAHQITDPSTKDNYEPN